MFLDWFDKCEKIESENIDGANATHDGLLQLVAIIRLALNEGQDVLDFDFNIEAQVEMYKNMCPTETFSAWPDEDSIHFNFPPHFLFTGNTTFAITDFSVSVEGYAGKPSSQYLQRVGLGTDEQDILVIFPSDNKFRGICFPKVIGNINIFDTFGGWYIARIPSTTRFAFDATSVLYFKDATASQRKRKIKGTACLRTIKE